VRWALVAESELVWWRKQFGQFQGCLTVAICWPLAAGSPRRTASAEDKCPRPARRKEAARHRMQARPIVCAFRSVFVSLGGRAAGLLVSQRRTHNGWRENGCHWAILFASLGLRSRQEKAAAELAALRVQARRQTTLGPVELFSGATTNCNHCNHYNNSNNCSTPPPAAQNARAVSRDCLLAVVCWLLSVVGVSLGCSPTSRS